MKDYIFEFESNLHYSVGMRPINTRYTKGISAKNIDEAQKKAEEFAKNNDKNSYPFDRFTRIRDIRLV